MAAKKAYVTYKRKFLAVVKYTKRSHLGALLRLAWMSGLDLVDPALGVKQTN